MTPDERWMNRCLQLAKCGMQGAAPNPMVGAVIIYNDTIIGEGYHAKCGRGHAEVNAIASVKQPELLRKSKIYVSLEPCAHYGKTPPCAQLIIDKGIPEVVVGMVDPFAKVNGQGIQMLQQAGIKVTTGVLEEACRELNKKFIVSQTKQRPFITLKWAQSMDGYIAPDKVEENNIFISTPHTQIHVHKLRTEHQAILVGRQTAEKDNPSLTNRLWAGNQPLRIALDRRGTLSPELRIFQGDCATLIFGETNPEARDKANTYRFVALDYKKDILPQILEVLRKENIQSLLVEGGRHLLQSFIDEDLWDEAQVELGTICFEKGIEAPSMPAHALASTFQRFEHQFRFYQNTH